MKKVVWFILIALVSNLFAGDLKIAVGAGYKKPLQEIVKLYEVDHQNIDVIYGNMAQIFAHAKQMEISLVVGDKKFLKKQNELSFVDYQTIGMGRAVIAYAKGVSLSSIEGLKEARIKNIAMPEAKKAIYGDAGMEFLKNAHLYDAVKTKLLIVATVPQVSSYVVTREVDVGIMNLTAALANSNKIGGYIEIPHSLYTQIDIVAASLSSCQKDTSCHDFLKFLLTPQSKAIFSQYGL